MQIERRPSNSEVITVHVCGEEVEISVRLARFLRASDRIVKAFVIAAAVYVIAEVFTAIQSGAIEQAVR